MSLGFWKCDENFLRTFTIGRMYKNIDNHYSMDGPKICNLYLRILNYEF